MPIRTVSNTSISGNRDTPVYVEMPTYDIPDTRTFDPYSFPTTTNIGYGVASISDDNGALYTDVTRQLERAAQIVQQINHTPDIPPPEKFFGATVHEGVLPALNEMRYLIKDIGYICVALGGKVPQFHITELDAGYLGNKQLISSNLSRFNDEAIINDMKLEYTKRQFYNIPTQLNGNNQRGSVFQYGYVS